jgi:hypothetical protein
MKSTISPGDALVFFLLLLHIAPWLSVYIPIARRWTMIDPSPGQWANVRQAKDGRRLKGEVGLSGAWLVKDTHTQAYTPGFCIGFRRRYLEDPHPVTNSSRT